MRRKVGRTVVKWALFVSRWPIGRIFLQKFLLFFSDLQVTFFGFFVESFYKWSSKLHFSCQEEHMQWEKHFDKTFFYHFRTMRDIFLNFHWYIWCLVVKSTIYVFRGSLWERICFFREFFKFVFGLWAIIVQTSGENFQQRCRNCIPCCQRTSRFSLQ